MRRIGLHLHKEAFGRGFIFAEGVYELYACRDLEHIHGGVFIFVRGWIA
jgi:hypothetical protein